VSRVFAFWLGKLTEAALAKNDEDLLLQIRDKDCVAIGVKYHQMALPICDWHSNWSITLEVHLQPGYYKH